MPAKRHPKKTTRQKRLIHSMPTTTSAAVRTSSGEDAIIRQFHLIQKRYSKLMTDVAKEFSLVKRWIGTQAQSKRDDLKAKINSRRLIKD